MFQALLEQGLSWLRWKGKYFTMVLSKGMKNGVGEFTQQLEKLIALAKVLGSIQLPHSWWIKTNCNSSSDFGGQQNA